MLICSSAFLPVLGRKLIPKIEENKRGFYKLEKEGKGANTKRNWGYLAQISIIIYWFSITQVMSDAQTLFDIIILGNESVGKKSLRNFLAGTSPPEN